MKHREQEFISSLGWYVEKRGGESSDTGGYKRCWVE